MHDSAFRFAKGAVRAKTFHGVVEFGSRNVNGTIRPHIDHTRNYVGVDIKDGDSVDVVQDAAEYHPESKVGLVICMETLEHAPNWKAIVANAARILRTGGQFIMTCAAPDRPGHSAIDGGPLRPDEYYQNVHPLEFQVVANRNKLRTLEIHHLPKLGDLYYLGEKLQ